MHGPVCSAGWELSGGPPARRRAPTRGRSCSAPAAPRYRDVGRVDLSGSVAGIPLGANVPLNPTLDIGGTEFGGIVPALVNTLPQALAASITPAA
jgi:hypothetical protein